MTKALKWLFPIACLAEFIACAGGNTGDQAPSSGGSITDGGTLMDSNSGSGGSFSDGSGSSGSSGDRGGSGSSSGGTSSGFGSSSSGSSTGSSSSGSSTGSSSTGSSSSGSGSSGSGASSGGTSSGSGASSGGQGGSGSSSSSGSFSSSGASGGGSSGDASTTLDSGVGSSGEIAACSATGGQVVTVATDGTGQFTTIQGAVSSVEAGTTPIRIDVKPGTYTENLTISRSNVTICGQDPKTTIISYAVSGSSEAAATRVSGNHFAAVNVTFENSSALGSAQAIALLASGTQQQFYNCRFVSYQDTLYTKSGSQYFKNCYVQGNTDYIFGAATAVLESCSIVNVSAGTAVTAPNTAASTTYGIVIVDGTLTATSNVSAGSVALGRPWGASGSTTYLNSYLGSHISAVGWVAMSGNAVSGARFAEYKSTGPGANPSQRAKGSVELTDAQAAQYTLSNIFGGWVPTFSQ